MDTKTMYGNNFWHLAAGIIMTLFGIFVWFNPAATLMALAMYLGIGITFKLSKVSNIFLIV